MAALRLLLLQFTVLMWLSKSGVILHRVEELSHLVEPLIDTNAVVHAWCKEDRAKGPCSLAARYTISLSSDIKTVLKFLE